MKRVYRARGIFLIFWIALAGASPAAERLGQIPRRPPALPVFGDFILGSLKPHVEAGNPLPVPLEIFAHRLRQEPSHPEPSTPQRERLDEVPMPRGLRAHEILEEAEVALRGLELKQDALSHVPSEEVSDRAARLWENLWTRSTHPDHGAEELSQLEALNERIASGEAGLDDLRAQGRLLKPSSPEKIYRLNREGAPDLNQPLPIKPLLFPAAHTGVYVPNLVGQFDAVKDPQKRYGMIQKNYQGILVLMPGIGASLSTAKTVVNIALTFSKYADAKYPALDDLDGSGARVRLMAFPLDSTLNGMAGHAPFSFASARGSLAVARHAVLILSRMYPGFPVFLAGRSQGGLIAKEYVTHYDDAAGAIAVNPSPTDPAILKAVIDSHESPKADVFSGVKYEMDPRSWAAFKHWTPRFSAAERPSKAPVLVLLGGKDPSYPSDYRPWQESFRDRQPEGRELVVFEDGEHDLWSHDARRWPAERYKDVVRAMARFVLQNIGR